MTAAVSPVVRRVVRGDTAHKNRASDEGQWVAGGFDSSIEAKESREWLSKRSLRRIKMDCVPWDVEVRDGSGRSKRASKKHWHDRTNKLPNRGENTGIHKKRNQGCGVIVIQDPR
jgi:hypothetical protein